jgi:molecular chaperone GrpE
MPDSYKSADKWQKMADDAHEGEKPEQPQQAQAQTPADEESLEFTSRQRLEDQVTALEQEADKYKQQAARALAELDNVRRRAQRDVEQAHKFGVEQLLNALLPVADGLVRGLESGDPADPKIASLHNGMRLTLDLLNKALTKFGLESISPTVGETFDPKRHEAMSVQPGAGQPDTIVQVLQTGYQLHGRVLRPAMVIVAK